MSSTFVTLKEVLEGRGAALEEGEVWGLLLGTAEALLDLSYKGQTNICNIIMPGSLLLSATGTLAFKSCSQSESSAPFAAPEMLQGRPISSKLATEKVAVYSLGMTLYWCVDYRVPQNQPVQLSDALNVLLLSMCEDLAHRRVGLTAILEACEEQHKTMPNLSPTRTIHHLVEQWSIYTAESASSDPTVPLSGRSQMVRERLHGKHSAYSGFPESNLTSGSRRRLSSDSEINKAGLSQQKMRTPWGRTSSPPFSVQTLPNRIQRGLQHRASSSSSWSSRAPYASDSAIRPASPPISISESTTSLSTRKAKTLGPEFVRMGDEPQVTLELPGSIVSKKGRSSVSQREVCVYMPNDACLLVRCDIKSRGRDVFDMVVAHANLVEHFYFGLAFIDDDEFFFLEPELKISKVAPDIWKKQPGTPFTLYLRVKFFADDVSFIQHRLTRHQYYLQLRKDVLEDRLHCSEDTALYLAALALQAEFGDYMPEVYGRTYFQVEQYVPKSVCERTALPYLREELPRLHANNAHMLPDEAEMEFLKLTQQLSEYGVLFHRVGREREKRPVGGDMQLGISSRGVTVYELRTHMRYMSRHFPWSDTQSLSTGRHKFTIECGPSGKKHVFQTESSRIAQYLLNLCSAQHKFHSEMTSRQLTHTLTSEDENLEKYLATCRRQHQMKRLSCSEMVLSNVGVANALASESISKSCDDLTTKADTHSRKLHDISETRESSQDISTPEPLHRIMSSVSLQKQDSETPSRSSSSRNTPTRTPPEREIICVTLKKDPKLGYGFVIVGEDNTGKLDLGIFIASIIPDGPADKDGRIRPGGRLISLNKTSLEGVSFNAAAAILQNSPEEVELIVSQPKQVLNDLEGGFVGVESLPGNEYRPGPEELEEALTTILTPKRTRRLHVPVVRILDTQDTWSRCSSVSNLRSPDVLFVELRKTNGSLGISVAGGVNTNMRNGGIYIKSLVMGGAADLDGRIQIGDRLLEVDGNNLRGVTHRQAVECLKRTGEMVSLLVERDQVVVMDMSTPSSTLERQLSPSHSYSPGSSPTHRRDVTMETTSMARHKDYSFVSDENTVEVLLHRSVFGLGFSVCVSELCSSPTRPGGSVVRIRHLFPGQPAMESGLLVEGDVILAVNGQSLKGMAYQRVMQILRGSSDEVRLTVCRPPPGTLPEIDTCSLSATPLRETRSMSLDLRMRDLSMDFHRLLQMKAEETRQEKQLLLQRLERLEQREKEEREREEREEREKEKSGRVEEKGREEDKEKKTEGRDEKDEKEREEQKAGEEKESKEKRREEEEGEEEEESPPSSPSPPSSTSGSEPSDTPTKEAGHKHTCIRRMELNNVLPASRSNDMLNKGTGAGLNNVVTGNDVTEKKVELNTVSGSKSSDTLNKVVELDDTPTKEEVPKDTSCVKKVELNNAAVRKAGSSEALAQKGEGSSEGAGSLTASHPIAAAGAVAMATDSSSPSPGDAALGHLENITFPSGVSQQVNGSTISMMADGLAFLADEEYLTISSLPHTHTHTHTHTSHPTHTHSHSSHPPHTHSHTRPVHTHSHTQPAHTHTHTEAATHTILATQCTRTHTHVHSLTSHVHAHSHTDCAAKHTHASEPPSDTHIPPASTDTHTSEPPPHTHTCATFADTHTAAAVAAANPSPTTLQPPDTLMNTFPPTNRKHTHTNRLSWVDEEEEEEDPNREILKEFELSVTLVKSWSGSFGFTIARSRLDGCYYIQEVLDNPARSDGRLRAGDRLIIVNGHDVTTVTDDVAMGILRSSSRKLVMVLGRAVQNLVVAPSADSLPDIILHKTLSGQLGIKLTGGIGSRHQGIYVLEVVMNSPASEEGSLQRGDKILYINGRCTLGMTLEDAVKACENASRKVKLKALRDDQPLPSKAKWNGLFDWKKERRFFPRFEDSSSDYEYYPEEGHESTVRFRPQPSPPPQEESCIIQVEFSKPEVGGLGFALMGGANGSALRVKEICRGGVAHTDGRLRVGDILLEVNGVIVSGLSHSKVVEMLRQAEGVVQLTICRDFLSLTPPTERRPPPTEHQATEVKDEIVPEKDQSNVPLNNTRRTSVHSQESNSSTPPVQRCCPTLRADDLLPTRISTPPPHDPIGDQDTPPAWSSEEEDEDEDETKALNLLPATGRPIVSEDELSTLAIISPCKTGSYSGSRIKTLIQILEHQDQQEILKEFMDLQHTKSSDDCLVGRAPENRLKNRYRDILPYDKTRVLLGEEQGYINASYIHMQVGDEELMYIASQAPMSSTVGSFWQMVWESRCDLVVMTTREVEAGRSKVYRYWPDSMDIPMETDRYQLMLDNHQTLRDFHINVVKMVDKKSGGCHFVKQVCVCQWPDHRPAGSSEQLVRLVSYMRAVHCRGPIIVHCSGGIGRTAVLICTDIIVRRIHRDLTVSVSDIVKEMRTQRHGMIQTKEQYLFCYKVWLEILQGILQLHGNQWQLEASV